ncbi:hypothetical protein ABVT39_026055 [Epinephelus coioides]
MSLTRKPDLKTREQQGHFRLFNIPGLSLIKEVRKSERYTSVNTRALQEFLTELSEAKELLKSSLLLNQKLFDTDNHRRAVSVVK